MIRKLTLLTALLSTVAFNTGCKSDSKDESNDSDTTVDTTDKNTDNGNDTSDTDSKGSDTADTSDTADSDTGYEIPASEMALAGGMLDNGEGWKGYAWTSCEGADLDGNESSIMPEDFSEAVAGEAVCAMGQVYTSYNADGVRDNKGNAILGWNLAQGEPEGTDAGTDIPASATVTPTGDGLLIKAAFNQVQVNSVGEYAFTGLRVQIQGPNGGTDPEDRWCFNITQDEMDASDEGIKIPWNSFNTTCWDNKGSYYNKEPLEALMLQASERGPGIVLNYQMCLVDAREYTGTDTDSAADSDTDSSSDTTTP